MTFNEAGDARRVIGHALVWWLITSSWLVVVAVTEERTEWGSDGSGLVTPLPASLEVFVLMGLWGVASTAVMSAIAYRTGGLPNPRPMLALYGVMVAFAYAQLASSLIAWFAIPLNLWALWRAIVRPATRP